MVNGMAADTDRVLVIGLDGADWSVIQPLLEAGELPHLAALMEEGVHGNLTTTLPIESPVAWTSMATGKTPGKHGIYGFMTYNGEAFVPTTGEDVQGPRLWELAGDAGRVVVMNVPQTFPPSPVNGVLVSGYLSIPEIGYTYPAALQADLEADGYRIEALNTSFDPGKRDAFLTRLNETVERRTDAFIDLLDRDDWRFGMLVYTGLDRLQHYFWQEMEDADPAYGDAIPAQYRLLDRQIGDLLDHVDENTTVLVVSDHGFGPLRKNVYLNTWLQDNGYLTVEQDGGVLARLGLTQQAVIDLLNRVGLLDIVKGVFNTLGVNPGTALPRPDLSDIDTRESMAWAGSYGETIYLNPRLSDAEREEAMTALAQELVTITDPDTGERVFTAAHRADEFYTGTVGNAPALVLEPRDTYRGVGFLGHATVVEKPAYKTGTHARDGIFIMNGPGIESGEQDQEIIDVLPTVLDVLGIPVPADVDGASIHE